MTVRPELSPRMEALYAAVARAVGEAFDEDDAAGQIDGQKALATVWPFIEAPALECDRLRGRLEASDRERERLLRIIVGSYEEAIEGG